MGEGLDSGVAVGASVGVSAVFGVGAKVMILSFDFNSSILVV